MKKLINLDCSLRDGGYYNNWDFSDKFINNYLKVLESVNIDYCELGFRFVNNSGFKGSCAFTSEKFINSLEIPSKLNIAIMINGREIIENNSLNFEVIKNTIKIKSVFSLLKKINNIKNSSIS